MKLGCVLWTMCGIVLLAGCGQPDQKTVSSSDSVNYNDYILYGNDIAYTDSAYFFLKGNQIFYLDADLSAPLSPLCARADCRHQGGNCNSYMPGPIFAKENQIYYLEDVDAEGYRLMRMDYNGTNREEIRDVEGVLAGGEGYTFSSSMGEGYLIQEGSRYQPWGEQP